MESDAAKRGRRPSKGEPVLDRAFRLLDAFSGDEPTLRLTEISERSGIPLSSALRLARQLTVLGALKRHDDGSFTIGLRLLGYAGIAPSGHGLRAIALPYMEDLHRAIRQHVQLVVPDGDELVLVERLSRPGSDKLLFHIGGRLPLHLSSSGLVLLAYSEPAFIDSYLSKPLAEEPNSTAVTDPAWLRRHLTEVRAAGSAWFTRTVPPTQSVAAPVFDVSGRPVAAISAVGTLGSANLRTAEPAVIAIARTVTREVARSGLDPDS